MPETHFRPGTGFKADIDSNLLSGRHDLARYKAIRMLSSRETHKNAHATDRLLYLDH